MWVPVALIAGLPVNCYTFLYLLPLLAYLLFLLQRWCRHITSSVLYFPEIIEQSVAAMSRPGYYHTRNHSISRTHQDAAHHLQPLPFYGPVIHKYALIMPSPRSFVSDCRAERNLSEICAAIRHHILNQVTVTTPQVSTRQNAVKDVQLSARSYSVRGTKWVMNSCIFNRAAVFSFSCWTLTLALENLGLPLKDDSREIPDSSNKNYTLTAILYKSCTLFCK